MKLILQLNSLVIFFTCLEFGRSFEKSPLVNISILFQDLHLIEETPLAEESSLLLSFCRNQHPDNVSLDLSNIGVIQTISSTFISSKHVTCLEMQNNQIEEVNLYNFKNLPNLEYLNLANNLIDLQSFFSSGDHWNLKTLILDNAKAYSLNYYYNNYDYSSDIVNRKSQIQYINLHSIQKLSLCNLQHDGDGIYLQNIDFTISPNLTHLFLSDNKISSLNENFFELPKTITHLFMERCDIQEYETLFNGLESLISLSLDGNSFTSKHRMNFYNHPKLKYLSIASCQISEIPSNLFDYNSKLVYLDISSNMIAKIPNALFNKTMDLETINLNNNQLSKIPNLEGLTKLRMLFLNNNAIQNVHSECFKSLENLNVLLLSSNQIMQIENGVFDNLENLKILDLSNNNILKFLYHSSINLLYLNLKNNYIKSLEFIELNSTVLEYLIISGNPITSIQPNLLRFLPEDTTIVINDYP